jgi:hypothetical protein
MPCHVCLVVWWQWQLSYLFALHPQAWGPCFRGRVYVSYYEHSCAVLFLYQWVNALES